jgi:mannitol-1-phosphate/altronate dehydrogenase
MLGAATHALTCALRLNSFEPTRYEKMKLRLLNASHQALCYIGMLLGYELVHETMEDRDIRTLVKKMMDDEVTPILSEVPGVDLTDYKKTLIERFANPAIRDQLSRIGIYGASGIPKFVLPSIEEQLQRGGPIKLLSFTVASWFRYLTGLDESGKEMPMLDPSGSDIAGTREGRGKGCATTSCHARSIQRRTGKFARLCQTGHRYVAQLLRRGSQIDTGKEHRVV